MRKAIKIGSRIIGQNKPVFIIAEAGVNHNGKLDLALKLVDAAADSGADAIKFQTFRAEQVVIGAGEMAEYQKINAGETESQIEMLRKIEFEESWYPKVMTRCKKRGIIFLSTPHGHIESANFLHKLDISAFKIGSGDLTNRPFLEHVAKLGRPIILGTGMANLREVKEAAKWIRNKGNNNIIFLHCTTNYPCPLVEVNLKAMQTMMGELPDVLIGYSDHTEGGLVSTMAVTLGACVIEKHMTLDKNMQGPDHKASSNPKELKSIIQTIKNISTVMGSDIKQPTANEKKVLPIARKSIVSLKPIKKGEALTEKNISIKRPGSGILPKFYQTLLNKIAKKDILGDSLIKKGDW